MNWLPTWVQSLSEKILPPIWLVLVICIFCGMFTFLPQELRIRMKLPTADNSVTFFVAMMFWFTLLLLVIAALRFCINRFKEFISRPKMPKYSDLTDAELAILKGLNDIPIRRMPLENEAFSIKKLKYQSLIEVPYSGLVFVGHKYDEYVLTALGKRFVRKNIKNLNGKFDNPDIMVDLIRPLTPRPRDY